METPELDQLLESLVDPIISIDEHGFVLTANSAVERVFGYARDELVGNKVNLLMGEPYRTDHDGYLEHFLKTGEKKAIGVVRKVIGRRKNGEDFPCDLSVSLIQVAGRPRFYGILRDMTERENLTARVAQVERLAAMGELAAGVAHEVNNPVNTIINTAQLIKKGYDDASLPDDIIQEGMRIAVIVRDLLNFARGQDTEHEPTDLAEVTERVRSLVERRVERQGVKLSIDVEEGLPKLRGQSHQLQQVLLNIILNARDALVQGGKPGSKEIHVSVKSLNVNGKPAIEIRIRDNGPGISPHDVARVFEPFFSTKKTQGGTGLGLSVSRGIVEDHDGTIEIRSELGGYAEFVIVFPAIELG